MSRFNWSWILGLGGCLLQAVSSPAQNAPAQAVPSLSMAELRAGFAAPPPQARLRCYWWWLNGHTDKPTITHDLEEMKAKGFGGALLVDAGGASQEGNKAVPAGPMFGSPAWVELYTHALREADRLGLEITLNIMSGWNLGGPDVTPEHSSKLLTWTRTTVHGGTPVTVQMPAPAAKNGFYRQIAVLAFPLHHGPTLHPLPGLRDRSAAGETGFSMPDSDWMLSAAGRPAGGSGLNQATANDLRSLQTQEGGGTSAAATADTSAAEIRDVSAQVSADGTLSWTAPAGEWEVLRIGYTNSDAQVSTSSDTWKGRALDTMSREAFDAYWDRNVKPLLVAAKPFHSLKYLAEDSWELGGTNWTETFAAEFRTRRGYDALPWLPVVSGRVVESPDASARFLTDLRRTVADLLIENHYGRFAERAAEFGLGTQAESGGPHGAPIDALQTFSRAAVPQTEFWSINPHRSTDSQRYFVKQAASAADIYGQRFVAAEGETSINEQWNESLATDLKPSFDMAVTEGLNRLVWHEFTSSPAASGLPGQEYFAGTHLNPKITWWNAGEAFFTYLNRVQFMMQQGVAVNDVLYFYGDNIPAFVRLKADDPAHVLPGYDYDVTDEDALLHHIKLSGGGTLQGPSGVRWRVLQMPRSARVSYAALRQAEEFVRSGGTLTGPPPLSPAGSVTPADLQRYAEVVNRVWGKDCAADSHHAYGKGSVYCTGSARAALAGMNVPPDVEWSENGAQGPRAAGLQAAFASSFDFVHRRVGASDVYFVRNGSEHAVQQDVVFRAGGERVELWDAVSGAITAAGDAEKLADRRTRVPLHLAPYGSVFVVFSPEVPATQRAAGTPKLLREEPIADPSWTVSFQPGRGVATEPVTVKDLKSWTEWPQTGVRYFAGTATYRTTLTAPQFASGDHVLLQLSDVREVARVKINGQDAGTVWAKPLTLRVDPWLHPGKNLVEIEVTNLWPNRIIGDLQPGAAEHITSTNINTYRADSPLLPSGLIGPLRWRIER